MKFTVAINAIAASASMLPVSATDIVASLSNERANTHERSIRATASENQGTECSIVVAGIEVENSPDVKVLSCNTGEMCVEDSTSSVGGRCVLSGDEIALERPQLGVEKCPEDKPKCVGINACLGAIEEQISCGSCNGDYACVGVTTFVGENSCKGYKACYGGNRGELYPEFTHSNLYFSL